MLPKPVFPKADVPLCFRLSLDPKPVDPKPELPNAEVFPNRVGPCEVCESDLAILVLAVLGVLNPPNALAAVDPNGLSTFFGSSCFTSAAKLSPSGCSISFGIEYSTAFCNDNVSFKIPALWKIHHDTKLPV